jgi:hypothetical protein
VWGCGSFQACVHQETPDYTGNLEIEEIITTLIVIVELCEIVIPIAVTDLDLLREDTELGIISEKGLTFLCGC